MGDVNPLRRLRSVDAGGEDRTAPDAASDRSARLLTAAGRGDERAFGELYDLLAPLVHGIVRRVLRDPSMADETTQDVMVELWRLAPRFDPTRGSVRSWAATVAHRRAVDVVRSEQARRDREVADGRRSAAPFDDVSEEVEHQLERTRVTTALDSLSDGQRQAVSLAYYGGHTYREVSVLLDVPEGTIKTRIRDGLIKLRDQFGVEA